MTIAKSNETFIKAMLKKMLKKNDFQQQYKKAVQGHPQGHDCSRFVTNGHEMSIKDEETMKMKI